MEGAEEKDRLAARKKRRKGELTFGAVIFSAEGILFRQTPTQKQVRREDIVNLAGAFAPCGLTTG